MSKFLQPRLQKLQRQPQQRTIMFIVHNNTGNGRSKTKSHVWFTAVYLQKACFFLWGISLKNLNVDASR